MQIQPLSSERLASAINLANQVFPYNSLSENAELAFRASISQDIDNKIKDFEIIGITDAQYWVALDHKQQLLGITGLYGYKKDQHEAYWLGWTCVDPKVRGQKIGSKLVDFAIEKARTAGKLFLRLYTSDHPEQKIARILYEKRGFVIISQENYPNSNFKKLYYELKL